MVSRNPYPRGRKRGNPPRSGTGSSANPNSNDKQEESESTAPATPGGNDDTDEQCLEHAQTLYQNRQSAVYASYGATWLSDQLNKSKCCMIAWECKTCLKDINQPAHDRLCSNLLTHAGRCKLKNSKASKNKTLRLVGISGTGEIDPQEGVNPFSALQEDSLKKLMHLTIVKNLPTRKMVSKAIHMLYTCVQEQLLHELEMSSFVVDDLPTGHPSLFASKADSLSHGDVQIHEGAIYLGVNAWQTPNGFDIIGVVIYRLIDDGKVICIGPPLPAMPLDFVQLTQSHTGKYLARMVQFVVEKFGLENQICGIVSDNASNKATMIEELAKLDWKRFEASGTGEIKESDDEEEAQELVNSFQTGDNRVVSDSNDGGDEDKPVVNDGELAEEDELTLEDVEDLEDEEEDDFRAITFKLKKSPNSKARFIEICQESQCQKPHNIERDVPTLDATIIWQRDKQMGTNRNVHINQGDLDLAQDLVRVLGPFYEITLQLSTISSSRVADVVVSINQITAELSTVIANVNGNYPPALQNACQAGLQITNKYYSLTDCSPIYRIAMVLHPSFKDKYFKLSKWPQSWIDKAINLTRQMYETWYKPKTQSTSTQPKKGPPKPQTGVLAGLGAAALARSTELLSDPINIWLLGGLILDEGAPVNRLKWWINQKRTGNTHHGLLQMALDVLCCPATTVDVERNFNFGRDYVSCRRHNLHLKSVSRGMALSFYSKNKKIKPLALHEYMTKRNNKIKMGVKDRAKNVQDVVTVE
ncbi:hypothetical protein PSTG_02693 [Puccinia striiformis f. sp. tritici PST-78]|uniref:HAT C-terminal dimerisation domain-containing protein n=1 Tax=Puccinia striiformis f. sp. tritici PST-78 TaxID=1165861 RepID=A0A0L0VYK9_9BASI|nr:hypothetical protein PSTG_02693 [Puccinia striiformis f. sp. tritici PST-78]